MAFKDYKHNVATTLVTAPTEEPVSVSEAKDHLRITSTDENTKITNFIKSMRRYAENISGRKFVTQTWKAFYADWPDEYFLIPYPTLQSVTHIKYYDTDGDATTWSSANYIVDTDREPGRVVLGYSKTWPTATLYPSNPIEIQFVCGYGAASAVPQEVKDMLLIGIERIYDRPDANYDAILKDIWSGFMTDIKVWMV